MIRSLPFFLSMAIALASAGAVFAACPVRESPDPANPVAYANRGDRCEGLFRQQVAASAQLLLLGVHSHEPDFNPNSGTPLAVSTAFRGNPAKVLNFRVLSSRTRLYYRMDASFPQGTRFVWKRDVISAPSIQLKPSEVKGLLCDGPCNVPEPTVLPVSISEKKAPKTQGITLWFRAAVDLKQLFLSIENSTSNVSVLKDKDVLEEPADCLREPQRTFS